MGLGKKYFMAAIVILLLIPSCFVFDFDSDGKGYSRSAATTGPSAQALREIINRTDFDVSNIKLMNKTDEYRGKYICVNGTISSAEFPGTKRSERFLISGTGAERYVSCLVKLDHPPAEQRTLSDPATVIVPYKHLKVIAEFTGIEELLTESGDKKRMPTANCIAIFYPDDRNYEHPLWFWNRK